MPCWMLMSKQGREEAGMERARASPEGCWAARSPSTVLRSCLRGSRSPSWVHNVLCLLSGVPEGGRDAQAGEAARQADSAEDNPPPGRLQGLPQPPAVQEAEGIHPLGCHTLCPPKPRLGPLPVCCDTAQSIPVGLGTALGAQQAAPLIPCPALMLSLRDPSPSSLCPSLALPHACCGSGGSLLAVSPAGPAPRCPLHPQEPAALPGRPALALVAAPEPRAALAQRQPGGAAAPGKRGKNHTVGWDGREGMGQDGCDETGSGGML